MAYVPYYPDGWKDLPSRATPIVAAALNRMESGIIDAQEGGGAVSSVNSKTGAVVLNASDVGAADTNYVDTAIQGVHEVPGGGSTNQVLAKKSNADYDLTWVNQSGGGGGGLPPGGNFGDVLQLDSNYDPVWGSALNKITVATSDTERPPIFGPVMWIAFGVYPDNAVDGDLLWDGSDSKNYIRSDGGWKSILGGGSTPSAMIISKYDPTFDTTTTISRYGDSVTMRVHLGGVIPWGQYQAEVPDRFRPIKTAGPVIEVFAADGVLVDREDTQAVVGSISFRHGNEAVVISNGTEASYSESVAMISWTTNQPFPVAVPTGWTEKQSG